MLQLDCSYMTRQENEIRQLVSKSTREIRRGGGLLEMNENEVKPNLKNLLGNLHTIGQ